MKWTLGLALLIVAQLFCSVESKNQTLTVSSILSPPYLMSGSGENAPFVGFIPDLLREITKITGYQFSIQLVEDGVYGAKNKTTGKWSGIIGDIEKKKAMIGAAILTITPLREEIVDFTHPFLEYGITFMISKPQLKSYNFVSLFDALTVVSAEIWALIFVAIVVITFSLMIVDRYFPNHDGMGGSFGWKEGSWFLLSTWMWQGYHKAPPSVGARVISLFWWFFCAVFLLSYSAALVHIFALKVEALPKLPATTAGELLKQSQIRYFPIASGSTRDFFARSEIDLIQSLWRGMTQHEKIFPKTVEDGVQLAKSGKVAFFGESLALDYYANQDPECGLLVSEDHLDQSACGIAVDKSLPNVRKEISDAIIELKGSGMIGELYKRYLSEKCPRHFMRQHAEDRIELQRQPINFSNFGGMFIILIVGLVGGFLVFALETVWMRRFMKTQAPAGPAAANLLRDGAAE